MVPFSSIPEIFSKEHVSIPFQAMVVRPLTALDSFLKVSFHICTSTLTHKASHPSTSPPHPPSQLTSPSHLSTLPPHLPSSLLTPTSPPHPPTTLPHPPLTFPPTYLTSSPSTLPSPPSHFTSPPSHFTMYWQYKSLTWKGNFLFVD